MQGQPPNVVQVQILPRSPLSLSLMHPNQLALFKKYEPHLQIILSRYPEPSRLYVSGLSPGTVRQNIQAALRLFVENPHISTVLDHNTACLLYRSFVFAGDPDNTVYIGPRRARKSQGAVTHSNDNSPPPIPPIDVSDPATLNAVLHLKNFDHLPIPITITNFTPNPEHNFHFPNVELIPNPDGSYTIL